MAAAINIALLIFALSNVKKQSFASSNSVCYSFDGGEVTDACNSRITTSLWVYKQERGIHLGQKSYSGLILLLILAGDVELCPGPSVKCFNCNKTIRKNQSSETCCHCESKCHLKCLVDVVEYGHEKLYCPVCVNINESRTSEPSILNTLYDDVKTFLQARGLKIFHQNVNGLVRKIDIVDHLLKETSGKIDILGISETHLNSDIMQEEVKVNGYTFIRNDRKTGPGGGVGCFIRNDLGWQRRTDLEYDGVEAIWLEIFIKNARSLLVCNIYRPPITSKYLHPEFETVFEDMINTSMCEDKQTILVGDMNADYLQQSKDRNIKRIISTNGLKQLIKKPTRVTKDSSTLIDIIATSHEQNILKTMTYANSISDHDLVGMIMKKNNRKFKPRTIYTRNFAKYNEANYKENLRNLDWENVTQEPDINNAWDTFKSLLKSVIDKHAPLTKKRVRGRDSPWFTNEIKTKTYERDYYLRKARKSGKQIDWSTYSLLRRRC